MIEKLCKDPGFLMNVFETMRDGLMIVDKEGNILYFNRAAEEITGYGKAEVTGKQCSVLDSDTCVVLTDEGKKKSCSIFKMGTIENKSAGMFESTETPEPDTPK